MASAYKDIVGGQVAPAAKCAATAWILMTLPVIEPIA